MGSIFVYELIGTAILILLGAGVVANTVLTDTLGNKGGWLLITVAWGFAVFAGASVADPSGGHLNPAVTLGLAVAGSVPWGQVPVYMLAQVLGAFVGAVLAWAAYKKQFDTHRDHSGSVGIFATGPTVRSPLWNTVTEVIGTFVLVFWILQNPEGNSALGYAAVAFVVIGIGASLGGPTGYAINPARDLGPRLAYAVLPIRGKGSANWGYAWVPIVGPLLGALLAGLLTRALTGLA